MDKKGVNYFAVTALLLILSIQAKLTLSLSSWVRKLASWYRYPYHGRGEAKPFLYLDLKGVR